MTKMDLMKLVLTKEEMGYCDTAIPMHLWERINTSLCVFDCKNHKVLNLAELYFERGIASEVQKELSELRYFNKLYKKKLGIKNEDQEMAFEIEML